MNTMEKPAVDAKRDSDSGRNPSDEEKRAGIIGDIAAQDGLPPDPDAHLSPEERAKIVSSLHIYCPVRTYQTAILTPCATGSKAPLEARSHAHPLAVSALPREVSSNHSLDVITSLIESQLPRSNKYWQCEDRRSPE
jgi:hypothetical protein